MQYQRNTDIKTDSLVSSAAYGLSSKQTFLFAVPYRLSPGGADRMGPAGAVATFYRGRTDLDLDLDLDLLWIEGLDDVTNRASYDIAWQYRLSPAIYPEWGIGHEWALDLELGGRWQEGNAMVHQATIGLQSTHRQWVFEAGVVQDLNESEARV